MSEPKWIVLSKSLWATVLPILAVLVQAGTIPVGTDALASNVVSGALVIVAAVLEFLNQRGRRNTVLPTVAQ